MITPPKDKAERDERLRLVLKTIEENPQHWEQREWHCETSHCFAGFAQCFARRVSFRRSLRCDEYENGFPIPGQPIIRNRARSTYDDALAWLGVGEGAPRVADRFGYVWLQSSALFEFSNTLNDLRRIVSEIIETPYEPSAPA